MKIKWNTVILDLNDSPLLGPDNKEITLSLVTITTLANAFEKSTSGSIEDKLKLWDLIQKIRKHAGEDFTIEEVATVKEYIGKAHGVLVFGRARDILEYEQGK